MAKHSPTMVQAFSPAAATAKAAPAHADGWWKCCVGAAGSWGTSKSISANLGEQASQPRHLVPPLSAIEAADTNGEHKPTATDLGGQATSHSAPFSRPITIQAATSNRVMQSVQNGTDLGGQVHQPLRLVLAFLEASQARALGVEVVEGQLACTERE